MRKERLPFLTTCLGLLACVGCTGTVGDGLTELGGGTSASGGSGASGGSVGGSAQGGGGSGGSAQSGGSVGGSAQGGTQASGGRGGQVGGLAGNPQGGGGASFAGAAGRSQSGSGGLSSAGSGNAAQSGSSGSAGSGAAGVSGGGPASSAPADVFDYYCSGCHGVQGVGGTHGPEVQHPVRDFSSWVVRHGLPGVGYRDPMEATTPDIISDAVLESIWDWLDEPPQPTTGEALYHDYCANCHGADGLGGPTMRPITNELKNIKTEVRKGAHPGEFDKRHDYMPAFSTTRLTDAEVQLIYDYVDSL